LGKVGDVLLPFTYESVDTTVLTSGSVVRDPYAGPDHLRRLDSAPMIGPSTMMCAAEGQNIKKARR